MSRRGTLAIAVFALWGGGLAVLARREYFRPHLERLVEASARVAPEEAYYAVYQGGIQIGYASSLIDTTASQITTTDNLETITHGRRGYDRLGVTLSRTLHVRGYDFNASRAFAIDRMLGLLQRHTIGAVQGDTAMLLTAAPPSSGPVRRVTIPGAPLLAPIVPVAIALGGKMSVGAQYAFPIFDPVTETTNDATYRVRAESVFVIEDSAVVDSATKRWHGVTPDTLHGWRVETLSGPTFDAWIDERGRVLSMTRFGLEYRRVPFEVAFTNWKLGK